MDNRAQCYALASKTEAKASDALIIGTILVCEQMANELFDPGLTHSYVPVRFTSDFEMCDILDVSIHVSTPVGESIIVTPVYRACSILLWDFRLGPIR